ncbi:Dynamin-like GTPase that mediates homotypic ER fusion [Phlyctochytrium bullatum]|nr:Dynamin-like GTPase that mediates homotypic ER fusion [Phlyctochytrium bullatum]
MEEVGRRPVSCIGRSTYGSAGSAAVMVAEKDVYYRVRRNWNWVIAAVALLQLTVIAYVMGKFFNFSKNLDGYEDAIYELPKYTNRSVLTYEIYRLTTQLLTPSVYQNSRRRNATRTRLESESYQLLQNTGMILRSLSYLPKGTEPIPPPPQMNYNDQQLSNDKPWMVTEFASTYASAGLYVASLSNQTLLSSAITLNISQLYFIVNGIPDANDFIVSYAFYKQMRSLDIFKHVPRTFAQTTCESVEETSRNSRIFSATFRAIAEDALRTAKKGGLISFQTYEDNESDLNAALGSPSSNVKSVRQPIPPSPWHVRAVLWIGVAIMSCLFATLATINDNILKDLSELTTIMAVLQTLTSAASLASAVVTELDDTVGRVRNLTLPSSAIGRDGSIELPLRFILWVGGIQELEGNVRFVIEMLEQPNCPASDPRYCTDTYWDYGADFTNLTVTSGLRTFSLHYMGATTAAAAFYRNTTRLLADAANKNVTLPSPFSRFLTLSFPNYLRPGWARVEQLVVSRTKSMVRSVMAVRITLFASEVAVLTLWSLGMTVWQTHRIAKRLAFTQQFVFNALMRMPPAYIQRNPSLALKLAAMKGAPVVMAGGGGKSAKDTTGVASVVGRMMVAGPQTENFQGFIVRYDRRDQMGDAVVPDLSEGHDGAPGHPPIDKETRFSKYDPFDPRLQIVNDDKNFSPIVLEYMKKHWKMADRGFDYNVVAVFGSQSTGKSTLLNRLFGTNFDVMNETTGRQQTTKGIWASKANDANLLVLDVEGTDGGERFEDQDFERKSALFSLAISEVVIVNMYENSVGLYNGANLGLLKTVLDVNLQLFQQEGSPKTCLHFVIRDFTDQTPLNKLAGTILGYLNKIWAGLSKPAGKEDCKIEDFFDFAFVGLPHKIFARDSFESGVSKLRSKFIDKTNPDYIFKPNYHKHIPADGFPLFAKNIWAKILSSRDLDLPTQTQLLAQHRCEEIAKEVTEEFNAQIAKFKAPLELGKVIDALGSEINTIVEECLSKFDKEASRYHASVYQEKRKEFHERMATALEVFYIQQLGNLHKQVIDTFQTSLAKKLAAEDNIGFSVKLREATTDAQKIYTDKAEASKLKGASWDNTKYTKQFLDEIARIGKEKRTEAIEKMVKALEKSTGVALSDTVQFAMNAGSPTLWKSIISGFKGAFEVTEGQLRRKCQGFESSEEEVKTLSNNLLWQSWSLLLESIHKELATDVLLGRLRGRFESKFRYDDKGVPRIWKLDDPIDVYFKNATDEAEKLLGVLTKIDVPLQTIPSEVIEDERFEPSSLTVLSASQLKAIRERFKKDADGLFIEAKRSMVITTAKIPFWFVALTVLLGWNEFMAVLRSPLYFISLIILGAGAYTVWYLGMVGPMYSVAKATSREVFNQTRSALEDRGVDVNSILSGRVLQDPSSILLANSTSGRPAPSVSKKGSATFSEGMSPTSKGEEYELKPTKSSTMPARESSPEKRRSFAAKDD